MPQGKTELDWPYLALFGIAAAWLLILMLLPGTGWLVRSQARMLTQRPTDLIIMLNELGAEDVPGVDLNVAPENDVRARAALNGSFSERLSQALSGPTQGRVGALMVLAKQFSGAQRAEVLADALRFATMGPIRLNRDAEESAFFGDPLSTSPTIPTPPTPPEALALFDQNAAAGELLEPDNAYFPMMRAVGLIVAHRDAEALEEIRRTGSETVFEDYTMDEARVRLTHLERRAGKQTALASLAVIGAVLDPHYAQLRAAARFVAYKAAQAEKAGRTQEGFALRRAMMRCGSQMRVQSHSLIGSLVGAAIVPVSMRGAGPRYGGMTLSAWKALSDEQRQRRREEAYCAYVTRIEHAEEASWVTKELAADSEVSAIGKAGMPLGPMGNQGFAELFRLMFQTMILLANAAEILLLSGAMWLLKGRRREQTIALFTLIVLFVVIAGRMQWAPALAAFRQVVWNLSETGATEYGSNLGDLTFNFLSTLPNIARGAAFVGCLIGPTLALMILGAVRLVRGEKEDSVVAPGLRKGGAAAALLLVGAYSFAVAGMLHEEVRQREAQQHMMQSEGIYFAELAHMQWPPEP